MFKFFNLPFFSILAFVFIKYKVIYIILLYTMSFLLFIYCRYIVIRNDLCTSRNRPFFKKKWKDYSLSHYRWFTCQGERYTHLTLPSKLLPFYLTVKPCVKGGSIPNTYPPPLPVFGFAQFFPFVDVYSATVFFVFCANFRYSLSKRKRDSAKKNANAHLCCISFGLVSFLWCGGGVIALVGLFAHTHYTVSSYLNHIG